MLKQIHELFMRYGIKSQTMDDIARALNISKKTLYKSVTDKSDLVHKVMVCYCESEKEFTREIFSKFDNAIDEMVEITKHVSEMLSNFHPSVHYDLEKYYPTAWLEFNKMKSEFHFNSVKQNIETGIKQGFYRKNLNTSVIARLHIEKIDLVFNAELFPISEFSFKEVFEELMRYHIRGIANEKGIAYLKQINVKNQII